MSVNKGELKISKMTLGTVQLGMDYGIANKKGKPSLQTAFEILDMAGSAGINSIDTANTYGESEEVLGKYFSSAENKIKDPFITTKFKIDPEKGTDKKSLEKQIYGLVEESLNKLHLNKIPVYMAHNAEDILQYGNMVSEILRKLKEEGLVERVGVSVYEREEVEMMLRDDLYEAVQIPINVFDLRMAYNGLLERLEKRSFLVFARSIFLQGLFFLEPEEIPEKLKVAIEPLRKLHQIAEHEGITTSQLAIAFIRDLKGITSLVLGVESPEQLRDNIKLMESQPLKDEVVREVKALSKEVPIDLIMKGIVG